MARQLHPLRGRVGPKTSRNRPHGVCRLLQRIKFNRAPQVSANAGQRLPLDAGTHIIQHQSAHRQWQRKLLLAEHGHADQTAHAGADPVKRLGGGLQMHKQSHHVARIGRDLVALWVYQPIALAAAHHVWANHPQRATSLGHQCPSQHIEVTPLAGQAMHTHDHMAGQRITPLPKSHAVTSTGVGAR